MLHLLRIPGFLWAPIVAFGFVPILCTCVIVATCLESKNVEHGVPFSPMSQPEAKRPRLLLAPVYSASKRIGLHSSSAQTSPSARVTPAVTTAATAATSPDETQESQWCPFYLAYTVKFTEE